MIDTPDHIKALQLKIWLSKPPMERLRQMMTDNEALFKFWSKAHQLKDKTEEAVGGDSPLTTLSGQDVENIEKIINVTLKTNLPEIDNTGLCLLQE